MGVKELTVAAKNYKTNKPFDLADALSLIREVYYRITFAASNKNPKQGKWLRLEQLTAIIISCCYQTSLGIETSEGKTIIIGWTALLKAMSGEKTDVQTHNRAFAEDGAFELAKLAKYFDIKVAFQIKVKKIIDAKTDILYIDSATAVLKDLLLKAWGNIDAQHRIAAQVLLDEGDNIVLDIQAKTNMQISKKIAEADGDLIEWISLLLEQLPVSEPTLKDFKIAHALCNWSEQEFKFWLTAAQAAVNLKKNIDYVVHVDSEDLSRTQVYIVHKNTTGCVDRDSKWSNGIHTCVAVKEKTSSNNIFVPGLSTAIDKSSIIDHLKSYKSRNLFTGTLGSTEACQWIKQSVQSDFLLKFPRAKRDLSIEAVAWPKTNGKTVYSRSYWFPPKVLLSDEKHNLCLLEVVGEVQKCNKSCIVFWNTIEECEQFARLLRDNGISDLNIQIYDDARDQAVEDDKKRPDSETVIEQSKQPKMITIATAVAGRGVNFRDVLYAFIAKPGLERVTRQKGGRVGRDTDLGIIYEIYNKSDLLEYTVLEKNNVSITSGFGFFRQGAIEMTEKNAESETPTQCQLNLKIPTVSAY